MGCFISKPIDDTPVKRLVFLKRKGFCDCSGKDKVTGECKETVHFVYGGF